MRQRPGGEEGVWCCQGGRREEVRPCFPFVRPLLPIRPMPHLRLRTVHREPALLNVDATAQLAFYKVWVRAGDDAAWRAFGETVVAKEDDIALALKERRSFMRGAASSSAFPISCRVEHRRGTVSWWCSGALQLRAVGWSFPVPEMALQLKGDLNLVQYGVQELECVQSPQPRPHSLARTQRVDLDWAPLRPRLRRVLACGAAQHEQTGGWR